MKCEVDLGSLVQSPMGDELAYARLLVRGAEAAWRNRERIQNAWQQWSPQRGMLRAAARPIRDYFSTPVRGKPKPSAAGFAKAGVPRSQPAVTWARSRVSPGVASGKRRPGGKTRYRGKSVSKSKRSRSKSKSKYHKRGKSKRGGKRAKISDSRIVAAVERSMFPVNRLFFERFVQLKTPLGAASSIETATTWCFIDPCISLGADVYLGDHLTSLQNAVTGAAASGVSLTQFMMGRARAHHTFSCAANVRGKFTMWKIFPRRKRVTNIDTSDEKASFYHTILKNGLDAQVSLGDAQLFNSIENPADNSGYVTMPNSDGKTNQALGAHPRMTPFMSPKFCQAFRIGKPKVYRLEPGSVFELKVSQRGHSRKMDFADADGVLTSPAVYNGKWQKKYIWMCKLEGSLVHASLVTGAPPIGTPGMSGITLDCRVQTEIEFRRVPTSQKTNVYSTYVVSPPLVVTSQPRQVADVLQAETGYIDE